MSLFDWLLVGHLVGDFLLQWDRMASEKMRRWSWMALHVAVYMLVVTAILVGWALTHSLSLWLVIAAWIFVAITHVILDRRRFTMWWMRLVGVSTAKEWLCIVVDQVFHLLTLAIVAQTLTWESG